MNPSDKRGVGEVKTALLKRFGKEVPQMVIEKAESILLAYEEDLEQRFFGAGPEARASIIDVAKVLAAYLGLGNIKFTSAENAASFVEDKVTSF